MTANPDSYKPSAVEAEQGVYRLTGCNGGGKKKKDYESRLTVVPIGGRRGAAATVGVKRSYGNPESPDGGAARRFRLRPVAVVTNEQYYCCDVSIVGRVNGSHNSYTYVLCTLCTPNKIVSCPLFVICVREKNDGERSAENCLRDVASSVDRVRR